MKVIKDMLKAFTQTDLDVLEAEVGVAWVLAGEKHTEPFNLGFHSRGLRRGS